MSTQDIAINRAIKLLEAAKVEYAIKTESGLIGTLKVGEEKKKREKRIPPLGEHGAATKYIDEWIRNMQPGEACKIPVIGNLTVAHLQGLVSGRAVHKWGGGNAITHRGDSYVELLRVE